LGLPDIVALSSGDCHEICVEPVHTAHEACTTQPIHRCDSPETCNAGIAHHHLPLTDIPLSRNMGQIQPRERLSELRNLFAAPCAVRDADPRSVPGPEEVLCSTSGAGNGCCSSLEHLRSVILLI
jgi:hypothetical protein